MIDLDKLEALSRAATPGPWSDEHNYHLDRHYVNCRNGTKEVCECQHWVEENIDGNANAAFIAAANPAAVLELITELRQTKKERDWLADKLESIGGHPLLTTWVEAAKEATCPKN